MLSGFRGGAIDYLLKPVRQERLSEAVERAKRLTGRQAIERIAQLQEIADPAAGPRSRRIVGKIGEEYFLLSASEIYAFQAEGDLVWIVAAKRNTWLPRPKGVEQRLKNTSFPAHPSKRTGQRRSRAQDERTQQPAMANTMNNDQEFVASRRQASTVREL